MHSEANGDPQAQLKLSSISFPIGECGAIGRSSNLKEPLKLGTQVRHA
jgi:hypothetical protein